MVDTFSPNYYINVAPPAFSTVSPNYHLNVAYQIEAGKVAANGTTITKIKSDKPTKKIRTARSLIYTYPRNYGTIGTYMPDDTTSGLPEEYKSQLTVWEGDKIVSDPYECLDLLEIRGDLYFNVPFMYYDPQRLWVRGRSDYTTSSGLVRFMYDTPTTQIKLKDSTIEPLVTSQWTRGIEGWWFMAERCKIIHCQDGIMGRTNAVTGLCNAGDRGTLIDWLTYFRVTVDRADSLQTHNDCWQGNGAKGYTIFGSKYFARYSSRGEFQPTIMQNVSLPPINNPANNHPESTCIQVNVSSDGVKTEQLSIRNSYMFGGYYPINFGDPGCDGTDANPFVIGEVVNSFADSAQKHGSPPIWLNGRTQQAFNYSGNQWYDGPNVGQSPQYRGGIIPGSGGVAPLFAGSSTYPSSVTYPG